MNIRPSIIELAAPLYLWYRVSNLSREPAQSDGIYPKSGKVTCDKVPVCELVNI
jgi:hypothetical protein